MDIDSRIKKNELEKFINERRLPISEYKKLLTDFTLNTTINEKDDENTLVKLERIDLEKECDKYIKSKSPEKRIQQIQKKINSIVSESSEKNSEVTIKPKPQKSPKLSDFTWNNLDKIWQQKLLSDKFVVKDCLADGNCQFRSIETALTQAGYKTTHIKLRNVIGKYIKKMSNDDFQLILENYRLELESGDFKGNWDPLKTNTKKEFINNISKSGFHFEGDNITLSLLSKAIKIDFIIFDDSYNITDLSNPTKLNDKIVILYYIKIHNTGHYNTIGYKQNKKVKTIFKRDDLPSEFEFIMDKNKLLIAHINDIYNQTKQTNQLTLNKIVINIQKRINSKLTLNDKKRIMLYIKNLLKKQDKSDKSPKQKSPTIKTKSLQKSSTIKTKSPQKSPTIKTKSPQNSPTIKTKSPKQKSSTIRTKSPITPTINNKSPKIIKVKRKRKSPNKSEKSI